MSGRHTVRDHFRLLFVCTANKCRSPMAELLFRDALEQAWGDAADDWHITSAGVRTRGNHPMDSKAAQTLAERGIDPTGFRNRSLTPRLVHEADLILTASREHRAAVAAQSPAAIGRLFTIKQFGHLMSSIERLPMTTPIETGLTLPAVGAWARGIVPARTDDDDLPDPIGRPMNQFRECADTLSDHFALMLETLPNYGRIALGHSAAPPSGGVPHQP